MVQKKVIVDFDLEGERGHAVYLQGTPDYQRYNNLFVMPEVREAVLYLPTGTITVIREGPEKEPV